MISLSHFASNIRSLLQGYNILSSNLKLFTLSSDFDKSYLNIQFSWRKTRLIRAKFDSFIKEKMLTQATGLI